MSRIEAYLVVHTCARDFVYLDFSKACGRGELFDIILVIEIYGTSAQAIAESTKRCPEPMYAWKGNGCRDPDQGFKCDEEAACIGNVIHDPHDDHVIVYFQVNPRKGIFYQRTPVGQAGAIQSLTS